MNEKNKAFCAGWIMSQTSENMLFQCRDSANNAMTSHHDVTSLHSNAETWETRPTMQWCDVRVRKTCTYSLGHIQLVRALISTDQSKARISGDISLWCVILFGKFIQYGGIIYYDHRIQATISACLHVHASNGRQINPCVPIALRTRDVTMSEVRDRNSDIVGENALCDNDMTMTHTWFAPPVTWCLSESWRHYGRHDVISELFLDGVRSTISNLLRHHPYLRYPLTNMSGLLLCSGIIMRWGSKPAGRRGPCRWI